MKLVLFERGSAVLPGALVESGVIDLSAAVGQSETPQKTMESIIDRYADLRASMEQAIQSGTPVPLADVRLLPPLPRPNKIMCCIANYWEHAQREARPLNMFLKNPDAVIGPGGTVRLPDFSVPWMFMHE